MDFGFFRGSFSGSRRFGWVLGIVVFLLLLMEPESWFITTETEKKAETPTTPKATTPSTTPTTATAAKSSTQKKPSTTQTRPYQSYMLRLQPLPQSPLRRQKRQPLRRIIAALKKKIA